MSRFIGVSAQLLAGMAICMDFAKKNYNFEAAPQKRLTPGKGLEASRAKLSYLVIKLLRDSSLSCLAMCRYIGSSLSWLVGISLNRLIA